MLFHSYAIDDFKKHPSAHPPFSHVENQITPGTQYIVQPDLHGNFLLFIYRFFQTGVLIGLDAVDYAKLVKLAEAPASERNQAWKEQTQALIDQIHINPSLSKTVYINIGDTLCERAPHTDALKLMLFSRLKRDPNKEKLNLEEIYSNHGFAFLHWFMRLLNNPKLQELALIEQQADSEDFAEEASQLRNELFAFKKYMRTGQESSLQNFCIDLQNGLFSVNEFKQLVTDYLSSLKLFSHSRGINFNGEEIFTFITHARASLTALPATYDWLKTGIDNNFPNEIQSFTIDQCEALSQSVDFNFKQLLFPKADDQLSNEGLQKLLEKTAIDTATKTVQKYLKELHNFIGNSSTKDKNSLHKAYHEMDVSVAGLKQYDNAYKHWKNLTVIQDGSTSYSAKKLYVQLELMHTSITLSKQEIQEKWEAAYTKHSSSCDTFRKLLQEKGQLLIDSFTHSYPAPLYELIEERKAPADDRGPNQDFLHMRYGHVGETASEEFRPWAKNMDNDCGKYIPLLNKNTPLIIGKKPPHPEQRMLYVWEELDDVHWAYARNEHESCAGVISNDPKLPEYIKKCSSINSTESTKQHYLGKICDTILITSPDPLLYGVSDKTTYNAAHTCDKEMYGYYCQKLATILKNQKAILETKLSELKDRTIFYNEQATTTVENLVSTFNDKIIALEKRNPNEKLPDLQKAYNTCLTQTNAAAHELRNNRIFGPILRGIADALMTVSVVGWAIGLHRVSTGKSFWCSFHKTDSYQKTTQMAHQLEEFNSFKMGAPAA